MAVAPVCIDCECVCVCVFVNVCVVVCVTFLLTCYQKCQKPHFLSSGCLSLFSVHHVSQWMDFHEIVCKYFMNIFETIQDS